MGDLRLVVCGGPDADGVLDLIMAACERGWTVDVTATKNALEFMDPSEVARVSGRPIRTTYRFAADGTRISPPADAMIVAPATFNTINKLANGIADTYPLSSMADVIGRGVPTVLVPTVNEPLAARRPFRRSLDELRAEGVRVLFGPVDGWVPGTTEPFPWIKALDLVEDVFGLTRIDSRAPLGA
jgi:phosphopantothenoylcysteine synthetase/decarboxylase